MLKLINLEKYSYMTAFSNATLPIVVGDGVNLWETYQRTLSTCRSSCRKITASCINKRAFFVYLITQSLGAIVGVAVIEHDRQEEIRPILAFVEKTAVPELPAQSINQLRNLL